MKTLARHADKTEILRRLNTVRPDSVRRWGRMSPHQMICHLNDSVRVATGERAVSPASGPLQVTLVKWIALYLPAPWPAGIQTRPEVDQEMGGTAPLDFAADVAEQIALLEFLATRPKSFTWPRHPIFGRMSQADWLRWAYLHSDHHLRQFGL
jgi:hypothetical protein